MNGRDNMLNPTCSTKQANLCAGFGLSNKSTVGVTSLITRPLLCFVMSLNTKLSNVQGDVFSRAIGSSDAEISSSGLTLVFLFTKKNLKGHQRAFKGRLVLHFKQILASQDPMTNYNAKKSL